MEVPVAVVDLRVALEVAVAYAELALAGGRRASRNVLIAAARVLSGTIETIEAARETYFEISQTDEEQLMALAVRARRLFARLSSSADEIAGELGN
jgi:hypothetical protein